MIFPEDSINARTDIADNTSYNLIPTTTEYTVLYESYNTDSATAKSQFDIVCGQKILLHINDMNAVPNIERFNFATCTSSPLTVSTKGITGSATTTVSVVYIPRIITTSTSMNPIFDTHIIVNLLIILVVIGLIDFVRRIWQINKR